MIYFFLLLHFLDLSALVSARCGSLLFGKVILHRMRGRREKKIRIGGTGVKPICFTHLVIDSFFFLIRVIIHVVENPPQRHHLFHCASVRDRLDIYIIYRRVDRDFCLHLILFDDWANLILSPRPDEPSQTRRSVRTCVADLENLDIISFYNSPFLF